MAFKRPTVRSRSAPPKRSRGYMISCSPFFVGCHKIVMTFFIQLHDRIFQILRGKVAYLWVEAHFMSQLYVLYKAKGHCSVDSENLEAI